MLELILALQVLSLIGLIIVDRRRRLAHDELEKSLGHLLKLQTPRVGQVAQKRVSGTAKLPEKARTTRRDTDDLPLTSRVGRIAGTRRYPTPAEEAD